MIKPIAGGVIVLGKLSPQQLHTLVFNKLTHTRPEVILGSALGEDSAVLDLQGELCVVSTDPITGASADIGRLGIFIACNDVATNGAEPIAVLLTIMAPVGFPLEEIARVMEQASQAAAEVGVQIVGGHTEVTAAVNQLIVSCTSIGRVSAERLLSAGRAQAGDSLLLVRTAGLEGTAIIALDYAHLLTELLSSEELAQAQSLGDCVNIVPAARVAADYGARSMHDVTEGGVLGAAYEMAEAAGLGLELEDIPVHPVTEKICQHFSLNPLRLISSGALLVAAAKPAPIVAALREQGIPVQVIGRFTAYSGHIAYRGEVVAPPEGDELWEFKASAK